VAKSYVSLRFNRLAAIRGAAGVAAVQAEALTQTAIQMGLARDPVVLQFCLNRISPPRKDRPVTFPLRPINNARDAAEALSDLASVVSSGQITPCDTEAISKIPGHEVAAMSERAISPHQLSDTELLHVITTGRYEPETTKVPRLLTVSSR
jgi:hypothetical protein